MVLNWDSNASLQPLLFHLNFKLFKPDTSTQYFAHFYSFYSIFQIMKRRSFLSNTLKGAVVPFFFNQAGFSRMASASFLPVGVCNYNNRVLVVIHLNGGNDIINTTVPLNQMSVYNQERPTIKLPQNALLTLDARLPDSKALGLNPALQSFKSLYDSGALNIIQRTGLPYPNGSHFASERSCLRGVDGSSAQVQEDEGWIGRFLRDRYPAFQGVPFGDESDPLGIMLGGGSSAGFHTDEEHDYYLNLSGQDPAGFYNVIASLSGAPITQFKQTEHGDMLKYLSAIEKSTQIYSSRISSVFNSGRNSKTYPDTELGNQLKTIARFMAGGSKTKVFFGRTGGWDTHGGQVDTSDTRKGVHADLLKNLSDSLRIFQEDLTELGLVDRVLTVVFSEFGRKVSSRGTGTDHGTLSSMFLVGKHVKPGVIGNNINLSDRNGQGAANPSQLENDNRLVFGSILQQWLGASNASLGVAFPTLWNGTSSSPAVLDLIAGSAQVNDTCYFTPTQTLTVKLKAEVFLEGFYNATTGKMTTQLLANDLLPDEQPFRNLQGYMGTESVDSFPAGTVDWVMCELRAENSFAVMARKAVLLHESGSLMDTTGNRTLSFSNLFPANYHLAIFPRNHLAVVTRETTNTDPSVISTFTIDAESKVVGNNSAQLKQISGKYVLVAGDTNQDGNINAADWSNIKRKMGDRGYSPADLDGNGSIEEADHLLFKANRRRMSTPVLFDKLK
jgi:uncharacterized protein (DUF1501 family)